MVEVAMKMKNGTISQTVVVEIKEDYGEAMLEFV